VKVEIFQSQRHDQDLPRGGCQIILTIMNFRQVSRALAAIWLLLFGTIGAFAAPTMSIGQTVGTPGATVQVPINITVDTDVVGFQFDLWYSTNYLTPGTPVGGDALSGQDIAFNVVSPGDLRVLAFSFTDSPVTNGVAIYVPFATAANSPDHNESLLISNVVLSSAAGTSVPVTVNSNAVLSVAVPPVFTGIFPTNVGAMHLELTGTAGRTYIIEATTSLAPPQWSPLTTNTDAPGILPSTMSPP
jgi:hypothetical protein